MKKEFSYKFYSNTQEAWEAMYESLLSAEKSILWETYIFADDLSSQRFVDILCAKALSGVNVIIVVDALGSFELSNKTIKRLRDNQVKVLKHNDPWLFHGKLKGLFRRIWMRSHRKILIVDEEIAFVGGVNVEKAAISWDDLQVRLTGRVVRQLVYRFAKDYTHSGGRKDEVRKLFRPKQEVLEKIKEKVKFILHYPVLFGRQSKIKSIYYKGLLLAKDSFTLVTPYYTPDLGFIHLISEARKRGVKVNIISPMRPDVWIFKILGRIFLEASVKAGATVYLLPKMNHAKVMGVDNKMGTVGSANLTERSMFWNRESGVVFEETQMVEDLNAILDDWKKQATIMAEIKNEYSGVVKKFWRWLAYIIRKYV